ncbi:hypothetical protein [Bradyrhizobium viridifuturi]|uniref:hypothetical protein n=1 Tax=Bradyrhizobium viridifuturi TaxID=1654716 RepID=UPI001AEBF967|nr:hypothetical protein [Bradyrhizobium viridifuturi]
MKQTSASVQQAMQGIEADQKGRQLIGNIQQKVAAEQGERKVISDQLGALSARVNSLESVRAESRAQAPPARKDASNDRRFGQTRERRRPASAKL